MAVTTGSDRVVPTYGSGLGTVCVYVCGVHVLEVVDSGHTLGLSLFFVYLVLRLSFSLQ